MTQELLAAGKPSNRPRRCPVARWNAKHLHVNHYSEAVKCQLPPGRACWSWVTVPSQPQHAASTSLFFFFSVFCFFFLFGLLTAKSPKAIPSNCNQFPFFFLVTFHLRVCLHCFYSGFYKDTWGLNGASSWGLLKVKESVFKLVGWCTASRRNLHVPVNVCPVFYLTQHEVNDTWEAEGNVANFLNVL